MKIYTKHLLTLINLFFIVLVANATHNRAGEITFQQTGPLTFEVTCITYTKASSLSADRDSLLFLWGDGGVEFVGRSNGNGVLLSNDIKQNTYTKTHTYSGIGEFTISMTDPNRNGGILNVNPPNSDQVPFHLQTTLTVLNNSFQGVNNSPTLLQAPVDVAYQGQVFKHTPNAFDIDGDSIAYELIVPLQGLGTPVTSYTYPHDVDNQLYAFNEMTGEYTWTTPQACGEYNLAILIKEYRGGVLISSIIRDMQIEVRCSNNRTPTVTIPTVANEICVFAGEAINFDIITNDLDAGQQNIVTATGGPFIIQNSAQLVGTTNYQNSPTTNQFVWQTNCNHIRKEPYQLVFKAQDDFEGTVGGVDLKVILIRVIPTLPENVQTNVQPTEIELTWDNLYTCDSSNNFNSFSVWRQECANPLSVDSCVLNLGTENYTLIANNVSTLDPNGSGKYYHLDTDIESGKTYCYRVLADFGFPFSVQTNTIIKADIDINYYPNPIQSGDWLTIDIMENINNLSYEVHNLLGQKISFGQLNIDNETAKIKMPEQENIYIVTLSSEGQKVKSVKIIVKD